MVDREKTVLNLANGLSLLRILLAPVFFVLVMRGEFLSAFFVLLFATLTDFIDGTVARLWNMQTRLGKMLDPAADKAIMLFAVLALVLKFGFPLWAGAVLMLRDAILLVGGSIFLYRNKEKVLVPNKLGKLTTFVQMCTVVIWLIADVPFWAKASFLGAAVALTLISAAIYFNKGYELFFGKSPQVKNLANKITLLRIAFIPLFIWLLLSGLRYKTFIAAAVFTLLALSDAVDGYIARKRHEITSFGQLIDPLADKLLVSAALIFLIGKGIEPWMAYTIIAREFLVTGLRTLYMTRDEVLPAKFSGKVKTVAQIAAILWVLLQIPYGNFLMLAATIITLYSGMIYLWDARKLFQDK